MAEKNCPRVAWLSRNNDNRSSGFFTRTCLHTSITICAHSDNHRRHSTPLQPLAPCSQREDILAAAPIRGPFEMDLRCIMWIGHPFLSIRADGNITIKHRTNLMLAFIAVLPPQQKYMNVESMSLIFGSSCVWRWVGGEISYWNARNANNFSKRRICLLDATFKSKCGNGLE